MCICVVVYWNFVIGYSYKEKEHVIDVKLNYYVFNVMGCVCGSLNTWYVRKDHWYCMYRSNVWHDER